MHWLLKAKQSIKYSPGGAWPFLRLWANYSVSFVSCPLYSSPLSPIWTEAQLKRLFSDPLKKFQFLQIDHQLQNDLSCMFHNSTRHLNHLPTECGDGLFRP